MHPIRTYFCQMAAVLCLILNTFVFLPAQQATSKAHTGWLRAYALSANNRYLVTAGSDGQLGVWDYLSGRPLIFFPAHAKVIADVAISTDEQFVFSVDESGEIKKWQILTGKPILSFQGHKGSNVTKQRIPFFTEQDDHTESSTRNQIEFPEPGVLTPRLATHKNGYLLSGGQDALLKLWDANTGKLLWSNAGHTAPILALGFSPDGKYCLSYAQDEVLKVWNTLDGKLLNTVELAETPNHPLRFSELDQQLILAETRSVSSWSLPELKKTTLFTLPKPLWALAGGSPGNQQLWYAPTQDSIALYQIEQKKTIKKIKIGALHAGLSLDKQGRILFMDAQEKQIKVYDPLKMGIVQVFGVLKSNIQDFKFSPNGKYLLLNDGEENVTVMDWGNPKGIQLKHFPLENPTRNHFYALDDQNQRLLTSSTRGDIKIWNIQTGQSQSFDNEQIRAALNVVWIKGGQNFAAWDFENGAIIYTGKDWLRVPRSSKSKDEAAIKAGNYIFQTPLTSYFHAANDLFISRTEREQQKKFGIYKHVGSVDAIYNRDSSRTVFVSKGSLLGTYNFETDKLKREDILVQYAAWVGNQTNMLFVVEDNGAYVKDVEHDLKVLQYALPQAALYQICPSGAHFLLLTPEQNLEIREIMSGKLLAALSWKKGDAAAQVNFNPASGNSSFTQWAQLQPLLNKPQGAIIQQKLDQLNPHSRKKTTGVAALLPKFGMPTGSISDLVFTKDGKTLVGSGYSAFTIWDLNSGRIRYIIENEVCKEVDQMLSTDDPKTIHIYFKKQSTYSRDEALNTTYWALNVETGKINKLSKKADEPIPTNQLNSKSQDLAEKPSFIQKDLNKWMAYRMGLSPHKTYFAFAYEDFIELWDYQKQQLIYKRVLQGKITDLLFDETEKRLVISTDDRIQIIDLSADKVALELDKFAGSLSYGGTVLESGEVVYSSGPFTSSFNLRAAKMSSQAGRPIVSSWFNGHEHTMYDDTGEIFYTGITESNARPQVSKNKKYLVYIDSKGGLVVWDNRTQQAKYQIKTNERYENASFDERDSLLVAHTKKNIELYQVSSGKKIHDIPISKSLRAHFPFHFSANSRYLAYLDADNHPVIWDLKTFQQSLFPSWANSIIGLSDASNKIVVVEGENVAVYPIRGNLNRLHLFKLEGASWNKSGHYFPEIEKIVVPIAQKICVLDVTTGKKLMTIYPSSTNDWVAISDDGLHFETSENGLYQMAYLSTTGQIVPFTKIDTTFYREGMVKSAFKGLSYSQKVAKFPERTVNTRNNLDYLKWFWEVNKPIVSAPALSTPQLQFSLKRPKNIQFLARDRLIHQNSEGQVQLLEPGTFRVIKTLEGVQEPLSSQVSKNQLYWVFIEDKSQIRLWSIPEMRLLKTQNLEDVKVSTLLITPDNQTLLAGCSDGRVRFYSLPDLQEKQAITIGKFPITALANGNSGPQVLVVDDSKRAYLYKLEKDQLHLQYMMEIGGNSRVISAQFNADDTYALVNIDQYDELKVINLKTRVPVFETSRMLMGRSDICLFDPVDPYILHFSNTLEFSKIDIRTGKKEGSLQNIESIHSYNPFEQQLFVNYPDDSGLVFDLRAWQLTWTKISGIRPPQILYFGDQLQKIYYPSPNRSDVFYDYDWSKNSITATLDQTAYQEKSKTNSKKPYSLILKKDSVQISDNKTGKMVKQFLWQRPMPKNMNISMSGRYLAYPLEGSSTTELFDLQLNKVILTLPFAANSYFLSLNDQYFFANNPNDKHMQVVELSTLQTKDKLHQGFSDGIQVIPSVDYKNTKVLFFHDKLAYQFINTKTGQSLGSFYFFFSTEDKPAWAFIAPDGRFDGSPDALQQFYAVDEKNLRTVGIDYKNHPKYQPGLLQKLLE